jgi:uncharacterized protein (DUF2249 family)
MIIEYTGQLMGGPDDGNLITASVSEFPAKDTLELWLDGLDKSVTVFETTGKYVWENTEKGYCFVWKLDDTKIYEKREL